MHDCVKSPNVNVEFIRLLFTDPIEEKVAYRWVARLENLLGARVLSRTVRQLSWRTALIGRRTRKGSGFWPRFAKRKSSLSPHPVILFILSPIQCIFSSFVGTLVVAP